jgi:hypothetical protein
MEAWPVTEYGDAWADRYDETFAWLADTDATVAAIAARARGGPVLELGTGSRGAPSRRRRRAHDRARRPGPAPVRRPVVAGHPENG